MGEQAVALAKAVKYKSAGTVEFIVDKNRKFYFLEMNTRLQVEHPVTEMITGQDLVAWQIRVARGEKLPLTQEEVKLTGAAIEVRLYAEDPAQQFLPQTGPIHLWQPATGEGVRIDHGIASGGEISPHYDPMVAKVIAWGNTREDARRRLIRALEDTALVGLTTNKRFLLAILRNDVFAQGRFGTAFIAEVLEGNAAMKPVQASSTELALALALLHGHAQQAARPLRSGLFAARPAQLSDGTHKTVATIMEIDAARGRTFHVALGKDTSHDVTIFARDGANTRVSVDGVHRDIVALIEGNRVLLDNGDGGVTVEDLSLIPPTAAEGAGSGQIKAPMDGAIVALNVAAGDRVEKGQLLVVLEAMKIQHQITADVTGIVKSVNVSSGGQVKSRHLLAVIEPDAAA